MKPVVVSRSAKLKRSVVSLLRELNSDSETVERKTPSCGAVSCGNGP